MECRNCKKQVFVLDLDGLCRSCKPPFKLSPYGLKKKKEKILTREGFTCKKCGWSPKKIKICYYWDERENRYLLDYEKTDLREIEIHHKKPIYLGGNDEETNLIVLCKSCHKKEHKKGWKKE